MVWRAVPVEIDLEGVGEFETVSGKQRVMRNIHRIGDAVHGDGIVNHLRSRGMVRGDDVVPCVWSEWLERDWRSLPMLGRVVKDAPRLAGVIGLPGIVVGISIRVLLTFELERLWRAGILRGYIQIELVP